MKNRPKQTNCQNEPNYPEHETVVFSIRDPDYYLESREDDDEVEIKRFDNKPLDIK